MSKFKTTGNNNSSHNAKHTKSEEREDNRGYWEGSLFQRGKDKIDEQCIKTDCPTGSFDPFNIPSLMNPKLSREEELLAKRNNNEKLNKTENMIVDIYLEKQIKKVEQDLVKLGLHGLNAKPETDEGRVRLLFKTIEYYLTKPSDNSNDMIYYAYNKIKELNISELHNMFYYAYTKMKEDKSFDNDNIKYTDLIRKVNELPINENIDYNSLIKQLKELKISEKYLIKYQELINKINRIIEDLDCIELQFNRFHSNMPPLNERGFIQLDPFQKEVITNIDNNNSIIVQAPTSAGKSILTGYLYTKTKQSKDSSKESLKAIVVVPTDPLAWQMSAYIGKITKKDVPIITRTFQSDTTRDGLIKKIKSVGIVVGTPQYLVDYLPLINDIKFDWVVVDEIHMIGKESCKEMELIIKAYSDIPIMALSATIGNTEMLKDWFIRVGHNINNMKIIKCDKRFFNLQKFYYDNTKQDSEEPFVRIHPLSMVSFEDFTSGNILTKTLNATPPDIWDLAIKLDKILPAELKIRKYFKQTDRITLDQSNEYFMKLLNWLVINNIKKKKNIEDIIQSYKLQDVNNSMVDLYNVAMNLKKSNKTPALIFQTDSHLCLELVRKFSKKIREEEEKAHPDLLEQRLKEQHRIRNEAKRATQKMMVQDKKGGEKKAVEINLNKIGDKKMTKLMMTNDNFDEVNEKPADIAIYEPHPDFILNNNQQVSQYMVDQWDKQLKAFFPHNGSEYHYIIDLLWRGVGVYCKGLPDPYLHIIQNLACGGKLGLVFSDDSLVFGVSMPFRTTVITPDENINSMMYHQMAGRAGRRGLDKEGNVILIGYTPEKIHELTSSCIPNVTGCDTMFYGADYSKQINNNPTDKGNNRWDNIKKNFLFDKISNESASDFYEGIDANLKDAWSFAINDNISFKHMMWRFRHSDDCYRVAFLLSFIRKIYKHSDAKIEKNQIDVAKFLSNYIEIVETNNTNIKLEQTEQSIKLNIKEHLETLELEVESDDNNIDSRVYESIRMNKLYETENRKEKSHLRERLLNFGEKVRNIQHYFFHCEEKNITKLLGKLLTRIWWIYHSSSPVMEPIERYEIQEELLDIFKEYNQLNNSDSEDSIDE
jgi:superfamily II DNA or RNA helicase